MAIQIYCSSCKSYNKIGLKECSKCNTEFGPHKKYRVDVYDKMTGKRFLKFADNLAKAKEIETTTKADMLRKEFRIEDHRPQRIVTLDSFFEKKYLPFAKDRKRTWRNDKSLYENHVKPISGSKPLDEITSFDIERVRGAMKKGISKRGRPFTAATIRHVLILEKRLFNLAIRWKIFDGRNPCFDVEMPKLDNQQNSWLSQDEVSRLLDVLEKFKDRNTACLVRFALFTGLRRAELFKLEWHDVDMDRGTIDMDRGTITLRAPKGGKTEVLPISSVASEVLASIPREAACPYVFPDKKGKQRVTIRYHWAAIKKAAGLPPSLPFHNLRHTFASTLVSNGESIYVVSSLLTHKDVKVTMRYAHLSDEAMRKAANKSGELLTMKNLKDIHHI
ncbi:MAG: site-specific integrase [Syntrophobacteraceae bacterium]|jgi:integrase